VRPLVLGSSARVTITFPDSARAGACVVVDGDLVPCRSSLARLEVRLGSDDVRLLRIDERSFIAAARDAFMRS